MYLFVSGCISCVLAYSCTYLSCAVSAQVGPSTTLFCRSFLSGTAKQAGPTTTATTTATTTRKATKFMQLTKCLFFVWALQRFYLSKRLLEQQRTIWGSGQKATSLFMQKYATVFCWLVYVCTGVCVCVGMCCCPVASFLCHFLKALQS